MDYIYLSLSLYIDIYIYICLWMKNIHKRYLLITFYYIPIKGMVPNSGLPHLDQLFQKYLR